MSYTEDELYNMSDDELEAAFKAAKAELDSPDVGTDEDFNSVDDTSAEQEEFDDTTEDTEDTSEEFENELESDLEQPDADSDHDASTEEDDADADSDDSESDEDNPDGDVEDEEDNSDDDDEAEDDDVRPAPTYKFKANGKEYEFSDEEIKEQFPKIFGQAMDYTKKMQAIKPYRKTIDALEQAGLKHEDVNLMIDVLKGDKDAISEVIKRTGTDTLDLDTENSNYVAKDYGRDEQTLAIKDVIDDISNDPEYSTTHNILQKEWDDDSWNKMSQDPQLIKLLHDDVKSGMYNMLQPRIDKMKLFGGDKKSDLEYYELAAREYYNEIAQEQKQNTLAEERAAKAQAEKEAKAAQAEADRLAKVKAQTEARQATKKASNKRKAAAPTKTTAGKREPVDYLDDSDEAFEEWYAKIQNEM